MTRKKILYSRIEQLERENQKLKCNYELQKLNLFKTDDIVHNAKAECAGCIHLIKDSETYLSENAYLCALNNTCKDYTKKPITTATIKEDL